MRLRQIEALRAVMATGSVTEAAALLHVSQPVVSRLIRHAETQLGFALFDRSRGRLAPTAQALALYPDVERVFADVARLRSHATRLGRHAAQWRLCALPSVAQSLVPQAIAALRTGQPADAGFDLTTLHTAQMLAALRERAHDAGVALAPPPCADLPRYPLAQARLVLAVPRAWGPGFDARGARRALAALAQRPFASLHTDTPLGSMLAERLAGFGAAVQASLRVQTYSIARALVAEGAAYALLDSFTAASGTFDALRLYPLSPGFSFELTLLQPPGASDSATLGRLREALRHAAARAHALLDAHLETSAIDLERGLMS